MQPRGYGEGFGEQERMARHGHLEASHSFTTPMEHVDVPWQLVCRAAQGRASLRQAVGRGLASSTLGSERSRIRRARRAALHAAGVLAMADVNVPLQAMPRAEAQRRGALAFRQQARWPSWFSVSGSGVVFVPPTNPALDNMFGGMDICFENLYF